MKKNLMYVMSAILVAVFCFGVSSCSKDSDDSEDKSDLIGTWDFESYRYYDEENDSWTDPEPESGYWVITPNTITEYDVENGINGISADYTYDGQKIVIGGWITWKVVTLTNSKLVLQGESIAGYSEEVTLKKR